MNPLELLRRRDRELGDVEPAALAAALVELAKDDDDTDQLIGLGLHVARWGPPGFDEAVAALDRPTCGDLEPVAAVLFGYWQAPEVAPSAAAAAVLLEWWRACPSFTTLTSLAPFALHRAALRLERSSAVAAEIQSLLDGIIARRPDWADSLRLPPD